MKTFIGKLCKNNHDDGTGHSIRYKIGLGCVECNKVLARKNYNPDKARIAQQKYLNSPENKKKAAKINKDWTEKNRAKRNKDQKKRMKLIRAFLIENKEAWEAFRKEHSK